MGPPDGLWPAILFVRPDGVDVCLSDGLHAAGLCVLKSEGREIISPWF
jgi:hypothetical protein